MSIHPLQLQKYISVYLFPVFFGAAQQGGRREEPLAFAIKTPQDFASQVALSKQAPNQTTLVVTRRHASPLLVMKLLIATTTLVALLSTLVTVDAATVNGRCTGYGGAIGVCISRVSCEKYDGKWIHNACPGTADDVKCCNHIPCDEGAGTCRWTDLCTGQAFTLTGLCPGPNAFKCCVPYILT
ncbi:hypothetical protein FRC18_002663 [Serendipita sp. 400]|nr:hypothetical protein FRC18_002663 [Serendipita sp. 400]